MAHRTHKTILLLLIIILGIILSYIPIIPTSYFITNGTIEFNEEFFPNGLDVSEQNAINSVFREKGHYGRHAFPDFISLDEYARYDVGILLVEPLPSHNCPNNHYCKIEVTTGLSCGGLCGAGAVFHIEKTHQKWTVIQYSDWVS